MELLVPSTVTLKLLSKPKYLHRISKELMKSVLGGLQKEHRTVSSLSLSL